MIHVLVYMLMGCDMCEDACKSVRCVRVDLK